MGDVNQEHPSLGIPLITQDVLSLDDSKHKLKHCSGATDVESHFYVEGQPSLPILHLSQDHCSQDLNNVKPTDVSEAVVANNILESNNMTSSIGAVVLVGDLLTSKPMNSIAEETISNPYFYNGDDLKRLTRIESECINLYPINDHHFIYESGKTLAQDINLGVGLHYGFKVSFSSSSIKYANAAENKSAINRRSKRELEVPSHKRRTRRNGRCGCLFRISVGKLLPTKQVYITKANFMHTHGCISSINQLLEHIGLYLLDLEDRVNVIMQLPTCLYAHVN